MVNCDHKCALSQGLWTLRFTSPTDAWLQSNKPVQEFVFMITSSSVCCVTLDSFGKNDLFKANSWLNW